jgi:hypothetical protein
VWGEHEENTARLLEQQAYRLHLLWHQLDPDPDLDEITAERDRARAAGVPRPPFAPVPPDALRPPWLAATANTEFAERIGPYLLPEDNLGSREIPDDDHFLTTWAARSGYG